MSIYPLLAKHIVIVIVVVAAAGLILAVIPIDCMPTLSADKNCIISDAIVGIIKDAYAPITNSLALTRAAVESRMTIDNQADFIDAVIERCARHDISYTVEDVRQLNASRLVQRFFNVLVVDSYAAFAGIYAQMSDTRFNYAGLYTVVLTESSSYQYETISRILQDCWALQITNVVVLVSIHPLARTAIYTYFPFTRYHCEAVAPVILNYFSKGFHNLSAEFFPNKLRNMHACPLRLALYELVPHMFLTITKSANGTPTITHIDGIDGITIRVLAQRLNFTMDIRIPADGKKRGQLFANGTGEGALGMLVRREVNLTIGAIAYSAQRLPFLTPSFPYYQSALLFAVPRGRNYTAFEKLFLPFQPAIWLGTGGLFVIAAVVFAVLRCSGRRRFEFVVGTENRTPFLNMAVVLLGDTLADAMPPRNFARYVLMVWMLACIVLRTAYQGAMFHLLQAPRTTQPIDQLDDLMAANFSLRTSPGLFYLFNSIPRAHEHLRPTQHPNNTLEYVELTSRPTYRDVYLSTDLLASYYNLHHKNNSVLISRERLFVVPFSIYFVKHSCLAATVDEQVHRFIGHGLLKRWLSNYYDSDMLRLGAQGNDVGKNVRQQHRPLQLKEVTGMFQICSYMLLLSGVVLGLEMLSTQWQRLRRVIEANF